MSTASETDHNRDLFARPEVRNYNEDERQFSQFLEHRLGKLLRGDLNRLPVLRRYHQEPDRLTVPLPLRGMEQHTLRLPVVEKLLTGVLTFLQTGMPGGPVTQERADGQLIERQLFATRFPHITIERIDRYQEESGTPLDTEWVLKRLQNQRAENRILRALEFASIGLGLLR